MSLIRSISLPLLARLVVAWGLLFAAIHFYRAAGGNAFGNGGSAGGGQQGYIAFIAAIGLVGAAVGHGLVHDWGTRLGPWRLVLLARAGGAMLLLGVLLGVARWVGDGGIGDDGVWGVVITAYFLIGGVLFSALGRRKAPDLFPDASRRVYGER